MKRTKINTYRLLILVKAWKRKELNKLIFKYFKKSKKINNFNKYLILLYKWKENKKFSLGRQINVCKKTGNFKRTFDFVGYNRHTFRSYFNVNKIPNFKKLSW